MSNPVLYLVRHGDIISVQGKAYIGQVEAPLSETGVEQAWALRRWLDDVPFSLVCSSDLSRSQRTARIIAGNRTERIRPCPAFREISLGAWEGFAFKEIESRFPEEYAARGRDLENWSPPGGESFADCRARVLPALKELLDGAEGNVLLVAHAGVNRLILCDALGIPTANLMSIGQDYGCVSILEYDLSRVRLRLMNFTPPLAQPAVERPAAPARGRRETLRRRQTCQSPT
ncbi:MAG TPA: histidine phosphatase family protein [Terracidiphilus sp.]|nr:histidine phosphatase family protein [Terracidiphilus sp.]